MNIFYLQAIPLEKAQQNLSTELPEQDHPPHVGHVLFGKLEVRDARVLKVINSDEDQPRPRLGDIFDFNHFGTAEFVKDGRLYGLLPRVARIRFREISGKGPGTIDRRAGQGEGEGCSVKEIGAFRRAGILKERVRRTRPRGRNKKSRWSFISMGPRTGSRRGP